MSKKTPPRARRGTVTSVPRVTTLDGVIEKPFRELLGSLPSLAYFDADRNITYAPFELLVYRTADDDLVYRPSYLAPHPNEREHKTGAEASFTTAFDYTDLTADPYWTPETLFEEHVCQPESGTLLELLPRDHGPSTTGSQSDPYPSVAPSAGLVALIQTLDRTNTQWAIQLLCSSSSGMTLRVLLDTTSRNTAQDCDLSPITNPDAQDRSHPLYWLHPVERTDKEYSVCFRHALLKDGGSFDPPFNYARGFIYPPARKSSLRSGIGGTVSGLENGPTDKISALLDSKWVIGSESTFRADRQLKSRLGLGVPDLPASVLRVASPETLFHVENTVVSALRSNRPTFVLSTSNTVITYCAYLYCHLYREDSAVDDIMVPERITGNALSPFLTEDRIAELRPWFKEMLTGPATFYLIDLSDHESLTHCADESTALLLSELSNAGYGLGDTAPDCTGNVFTLTPQLLSATNAHQDIVERALRKTSEHRLAIDVATTYAVAESNRSLWDSISQSADIVMAANDGQSASFVLDNRLLDSDCTLAKEITTNGSDALWNTRFDLRDWAPFILPVRKLAQTDATPAPTETKSYPHQQDALEHVLSSFATVDVPDPGVNTQVPSYTGLSASTGGSIRERTHIPRHTALPPAIEYDDTRQCYKCMQCFPDDGENASLRDATTDGLRAAITCCESLDEVDRDALRRMPDPALKVTAEDIEESDLSLNHFKFLKGLYLVETQQVDHYFEYDPLRDSGTKLRDDYDLAPADIDLLKQHGYITEDTDPHVLYTVTPAGRRHINEPWKQGQEYGPGIRELNDTLEHYTMVRGSELDYKARFGDDPTLHVETYVPIEVTTPDGETVTKNIDVAVLDTDGNIIHATEAERENSDQNDSVVETYRKLCTADPDTARWVVPNSTAATNLFDDLATQAAAGRIDYSGATYSDTTSPADINPDEPGITAIEIIRNLKHNAIEKDIR
ncbi:hypothetical protein [Natrinema sp. H-ect4]|uniref:hypothetical protein n=1 Tax=Natrinema sp. H-ect4 TaxID=3242699 RepID=UPI0035A9AA95